MTSSFKKLRRYFFPVLLILGVHFNLAAQPDVAGTCPPDRWDTSFTTNGTDGTVRAITVDSSGNYYIGGDFDTVQGVPANGIAKWDGSKWTSLGTGVSGAVYAIAVSGNDVYVGGAFNTAGGVVSRNIAKWDGNSWSAMGNGLGQGTHIVRSVAVYNGDVFVGGNFSISDGSPANGLVRWNGTSFAGVGTLAASEVRALAVNGGFLYVGGFVAPTTGASVGIVRWDGTSWSDLGTSTTSNVSAITFSGSDMYVGGGRIVIPGQQDAQVAKFDGTTWTRLGFFSNGIVNAIAVIGSDLYVGGSLTEPPNLFNSLAKWNGTSWTGVSGGVLGGTSVGERVTALGVSGNTLIVGGNYTTAGGLGARNLSTVTAGTWAAFSGTGIDSPAKAIAVSATDVYVGGSFITAGSLNANRIAKWNGATWSAMSTGIQGSNSTVNALAVAGTKVYVGGVFTNAGGVNANNIAVWNGQTWSALGSGVDGAVTKILVRGEEVFVAGSFQSAGGIPTNRIAKWNGTAWSAIAGSPIPATVTGLEVLGDDIFVSTDSTSVENPNYLLKYDGTSWTPMAPTFGGHGIRSMAVIGDDLYIAGGFLTLNGMTANRVAKWDGKTWSALGGGLPGTLITNQIWITASGNDLIASGDFPSPSGRIARWNGTSWSELGSGLDNHASALTSVAGNLYVGGGFSTAGCNISPYFARWRETIWNGNTNTDWHLPENWGSGSVPTPGAGVTIESGDASISSANVTLSSLTVTNGRTLTVGSGRTLTVTGNVDLRSGEIAGPGSLVVNGNILVDSSGLTGLASVLVNGDVYLNNGGAITGVTSLAVSRSLFMNGGDISDVDLVTIGGSLRLNTGRIAGSGLVDVTACTPAAISGDSGASFIAGPLKRCVNGSGTYRFPVGTGSDYLPVDLSNIVGNGSVTVDQRSGQYSGTASGLPVNRLQRWWQLSNSGVAQADLTLNYLNSEVVGNEDLYRAFGISGGAAIRLTTALDRTANRAVLPGVTNFAAFTLAEVDASSAPLATLTGRVTTPSGRGAERVTVTMTDSLGNTRHGKTNPSGYYWFVDVPTFQFYTLTVSSKKFRFNPASKIAQVDGNVTDFGFVSIDH